MLELGPSATVGGKPVQLAVCTADGAFWPLLKRGQCGAWGSCREGRLSKRACQFGKQLRTHLWSPPLCCSRAADQPVQRGVGFGGGHQPAGRDQQPALASGPRRRQHSVPGWQRRHVHLQRLGQLSGCVRQLWQPAVAGRADYLPGPAAQRPAALAVAHTHTLALADPFAVGERGLPACLIGGQSVTPAVAWLRVVHVASLHAGGIMPRCIAGFTDATARANTHVATSPWCAFLLAAGAGAVSEDVGVQPAAGRHRGHVPERE